MATITTTPFTLGFASLGPTVAATAVNLNAANNRAGLRFIISTDKTLNSVHWYCYSKTGTLAATDAVCDIYATGTDGKPTGASLASSSTLASALAAGSMEFTGFNLALTAGDQYVAVIKNVNADPASNWFSTFYATAMEPVYAPAHENIYCWAHLSSTDGGSTWTIGFITSANIVLAFSDSTYAGWLEATPTNGAATARVYASRESGMRLTTPAGATMNVRGVLVGTGLSTGTPTGKLRAIIRRASNNEALGTSLSIAPSLLMPVGNERRILLLFSSVVAIPASTDIRVVIGETTQSDTSSHRYNLFQHIILAGGQNTVPWSARNTYYDGSSWADDAAALPWMALCLDVAPFAASTGGGTGFLGIRGCM